MERVDYESLVIQDLINLNKSDELDIAPWYQRRSVWTNPQKGYLINTIYSGKPVPTIYIRHKLDLEREKSIKEVVDGQQRIRAILEFRDDGFAFRHPETGKRVKYSALSAKDRSTFLMTKVAVGYLIGASDADVIDIFGRINSVAKTLNDQEKRNANFSGEFKQFCLEEAAKRINVWRDFQIFTATEISRMQEVKFISELALNMMKGLSDLSSRSLDNLYEEYDDKFPQWFTIEKRFDHIFAKLAEVNSVQIKDTAFKRQPLFFSLFLILDKKRVTTKTLAKAIIEITNRFNESEPASKKDADFITASTATTQRIAQRRVREKYIASFL